MGYKCGKCGYVFKDKLENCPNCGVRLVYAQTTSLVNERPHQIPKQFQKLKEIKQKRPLKTIITSIIFFVVGLILVLLTTLGSFDKDMMANLMWLGLSLLSFSIPCVTYLALSSYSHINIFLKILLTVLSIGILVGLYFIFLTYLVNNAAKYGGDKETILIAVISSVGTAGLLEITYIIFSIIDREDKAYFLMLILSPAIAFLSMMIANIIHIFGVTWIVNTVAAIVTFIILAKASHYISSSDTVTKYYISDGINETEVEDIGGGEYRDSNGNVYRSDNGTDYYKTN